MTSQVIDGRARAARLRAEVAEEAAALGAATGVQPTLAVVLVGEDPASQVYVRSKIRACEEAGIRSLSHLLADTVTEAELLALIADLNRDASVHGILVQLPLPAQIDCARVIDAIAPEKDVDGFHAINAGRLATGQPGIVPCTPLGCMMLLDETLDRMEGLTACVIGCSTIVGRPMIQLLLQRNCSVLVAHKFTADTPALTRQADILVVAAGAPGLVREDWVKPGAVIIDVGINRVDRAIRGDVTPEAQARARAFTPVPGGVGPMTIACLLSNTLDAARAQTLAATAAA